MAETGDSRIEEDVPVARLGGLRRKRIKESSSLERKRFRSN